MIPHHHRHVGAIEGIAGEMDQLLARLLRYNELTTPEPVPRDTDFAAVIESDVPIVVQQTRLDSRQAENALISTSAFPAAD
jgi:hypothetical protein